MCLVQIDVGSFYPCLLNKGRWREHSFPHKKGAKLNRFHLEGQVIVFIQLGDGIGKRAACTPKETHRTGESGGHNASVSIGRLFL